MNALFIRQQEEEELFSQSFSILSFGQFFHQKETGGSFRCGENGAFVFRANNSIDFPVSETFFLIGGVKVYGKFSSGDPDTAKTAASWFGACLTLSFRLIKIVFFSQCTKLSSFSKLKYANYNMLIFVVSSCNFAD
jgi:hypothetical protein